MGMSQSGLSVFCFGSDTVRTYAKKMKEKQFLTAGGSHFYIDDVSVTKEVFDREIWKDSIQKKLDRIEKKLEKLQINTKEK